MTSGLHGDYDRLDHLIEAARSIHQKPFWRRLLRGVSDEVNRQITAGFWLGRDPYGRRWQPLKFGTNPPLMRSKALLRAAQSRPVEAITAVAVSIDLVYAGVQQRGATIRARPGRRLVFRAGPKTIFARKVVIPARPFLPDGELPPTWRDGIANVIDAQIARTLKG